MKILHTSDWHLGHRLLHRDREQEHQLALDWLLALIVEEQIEVLIISGDIFDIRNPPNVARRMYYQFLTDVVKTSCRYVIVVGGNHDSPSMLEAPKMLLSNFNIHVCGGLPEQMEDQIVEIKSQEGKLEAIIAMVPFLRDRDLDKGTSGEGSLERIERIRKSIAKHYETLAQFLQEHYDNTVPIITTGHLYATGAEASGTQNNIYIGDKENIDAGAFSAVYDYVALGHIHRPQTIGGNNHIRYSGSLIPMSFSETKDEKGVYILTFEGKKVHSIDFKPIPQIRRLKTIEGTLEEVELKLKSFISKERELTPWVEVIVNTDKIIPRLDLELQTLTKGMNLELLKIRVQHEYQSLAEQMSMNDLDTLDVIEVFRKRCTTYGTDPEEIEQLESTFKELINWLDEQEVA